jgi:predicted enzyme related to lactoylglutathione lyase
VKSGIVDSLHKVIGEMVVLAMVSVGLLSSGTSAQTGGGTAPGVAVGAQYDSAHVYLSPADLDAFVASFTATFGGTASKKSVTNVLPVPSTTEFQYVWTPVGTLSVFAYETAIPFPFGSERTGYLVTDMDEAIREAHSAGAEVIVEPFRDPIGRDAVIQWPGGVKMQLYWHTAPPKYGALATTPENRVYVSRDAANAFVGDFLAFSQGKVVGDDPRADGGEIGRRGETYRCIRITSHFGNMRVLVTDGHLPYPFGHEVMGYEVGDLTASLARAKAAGAKVLAAPYASKEGASVIVQFPGGYVAEIHAAR